MLNGSSIQPIETEFNTDAKEEDGLRLTSEVSPISTRLSGPQEPPSDQSMWWLSLKPDKGRAKMPEFKDSDRKESTHSLDSEYGGLDVPIIRTPIAKKQFMKISAQLHHFT